MSWCCWLSSIGTLSVETLATLIILFVIGDWILRKKRAASTLDGQHVFITGGSSGIGLKLAISAASRGANVTIVSRSVDKLEEAVKTIRAAAKSSSQQNINFFKADVTKYEEVEKVVNRCEIEIGPVEILITAAGYAYPSKLEDIPLDHIRGMMDLNYLGTVYAVRCVLPSMKSRQSGKIVCISSVGGLIGLYGYTGYSATKFAVRGFAESLQMEVKPYGISVTLGLPPDTDTPGLEEENRTKPTELKLISNATGTFSAEKVAQDILNDALAGDFFSSSGFDGNLATVVCAGLSPMSSLWGVLVQTLCSGLLRFVSLGYLYYYNRIVSKCHEEKERKKKSN